MAMAKDGSQVRDKLASVLSQFYDFGDEKEREEQNESEEPEKDIAEKNTPEDRPLPIVHSKKGKKSASLFFNSIKDELCSQPKCTKLPANSASNQNVEIVTFASRREKEETKSKEDGDKDSKISIDLKEDGNGGTVDIEQARLEVHKFGITGYKKERQRKFEQERAIMLGAKPPKREYVNYKVYQERQKELNQAKKEKRLAACEAHFTESGSEPVKKKAKLGLNDRRLRKTKGLSGNTPDGQVGRFRDGALILSSRDIQKIKQSKVIK